MRFIHLNKLRFEFCLIQRYRLSVNLFDKLPTCTWVRGDFHLLDLQFGLRLVSYFCVFRNRIVLEFSKHNIK